MDRPEWQVCFLTWEYSRLLERSGRAARKALEKSKKENMLASSYTTSSVSPRSKTTEAAYSMCRTRRGTFDCDFDDECTTSGRIARIPPRGTVQSIALNLCRQIAKRFVTQNAEGVRSGEHTRRSVFGNGIVKMQPKRQHLFKRAGWSVRIVHSMFSGPRSPAGNFSPLGRVAMPCPDATPQASLRLATCRTASREREVQPFLELLAPSPSTSNRAQAQRLSRFSSRCAFRLGFVEVPTDRAWI